MNREQLINSGTHAAYKLNCTSVLIAPDHTGELNYHNCDHSSKPHFSATHFCGCGYEWINHGYNAEILTVPSGFAVWYVLRDGKPLAKLGDEASAYAWLQRHQPMSTDWAKKHEGYAITEVRNNA